MTVYRWGPNSNRIRAELHEDLRMLFDVALDISPFDLAVTDGHRSKEDRKSTRLNSSHSQQSRMPSSA